MSAFFRLDHVRRTFGGLVAVSDLSFEIEAGSIVAFSSLLLHATGANRSDRARRVYLAQYSPEVILDPGTRQLRRNAIALLRANVQVTFA